MNRRHTWVFAASFLALGMGSAAMAAILPLRVWVPAPFLAAALLLGPREAVRKLEGLLPSLALFFLFAVLAAGSLRMQTASSTGLLLVSVALFSPLAAAGLRTLLERPATVDFAVLTAIAFAGWSAAASALAGIPGADPRPFVTVLLAALLSRLIGRGARDRLSPGIVRAIPATALLLVTMGGGSTLLRWALARQAGMDHLHRGQIEEAFRAGRDEQFWASQLGMRKPHLDSLRRQADIVRDAGQPDLWRATMQQIVDISPRDTAAWQALFEDALERNLTNQTLEAFRNIERTPIEPEAARAVLIMAIRANDADAIARALARCSPDILDELPADIDLTEAGRALYFSDCTEGAESFLSAAILRDDGDWDATRTLASLYYRSGRTSEAHRILESAERGAEHEDERAFLMSRTGGDPDGQPVFGGALQLTRFRLTEDHAEPGDLLGLELGWRALGPLNPKWRVFVHVRGNSYESGFFQADHRFSDYGIDLEQWPAGQEKQYTVRIPIPKGTQAGRYTALVGIWDGTRREPPSACGAADAAPVTEKAPAKQGADPVRRSVEIREPGP